MYRVLNILNVPPRWNVPTFMVYLKLEPAGGHYQVFFQLTTLVELLRLSTEMVKTRFRRVQIMIPELTCYAHSNVKYLCPFSIFEAFISEKKPKYGGLTREDVDALWAVIDQNIPNEWKGGAPAPPPPQRGGPMGQAGQRRRGGPMSATIAAHMKAIVRESLEEFHAERVDTQIRQKAQEVYAKMHNQIKQELEMWKEEQKKEHSRKRKFPEEDEDMETAAANGLEQLQQIRETKRGEEL